MQNEIWKKIAGFENYSVSDQGNVRNDKNGKVKNVKVNDTGYIKIGLMKDDKKFKKKSSSIGCIGLYSKP